MHLKFEISDFPSNLSYQHLPQHSRFIRTYAQQEGASLRCMEYVTIYMYSWICNIGKSVAECQNRQKHPCEKQEP